MNFFYFLLCFVLTSSGFSGQPMITDNLIRPTNSFSGKTPDVEPTVQGSITFGAVTNSTIEVYFSGGDGAKRILIARQAAAVDSDPADGTTYTDDANFGSGSQLGTGNYVVYAGYGSTQLVTGLTPGIPYYFAVYEYNDAGGVPGEENYLLPGAVENTSTTNMPEIYTWQGGNGDWTIPSNWLPSRNLPAPTDILFFIDGGIPYTITGVPDQTIGYLEVSMGTRVTLEAAADGTTLAIGDLAGYDLYVGGGSSLNISGTNAYAINLPTGATAFFDGDMTLSGGAHKLTAADAGGITFGSGATFTAGTGFSGNPFGAGMPNSVIFSNGSYYQQLAGSDPFSLAVPNSVTAFQSGSIFRMLSNLPLSIDGRTYGDVEIDNPAFAHSDTVATALNIDNLTVTEGNWSINLMGADINIKGNIYVAPGASLGFNPSALSTLNFEGTVAQTITNEGTFTYGPLQSLTINNAAGVTSNSDINLGPGTTLTLASGILKFVYPASTISLSATTTLAGTPSDSAFIDGKVKKTGNAAFTFPVGKTGFGYVPIGISNFSGGAATDAFTAEYVRGSARMLGAVTDPLIDHVSGCDYWTLELNNGTPAVDVTAYWSPASLCYGTYIDSLADLALVHFDGSSWNSSSAGVNPSPNGNNTYGNITWPGVATFSPFALGSKTLNNPLPVIINYLTGTKQNGRLITIALN
ncbi:MAG: hypothetical protein IPP96_06745 [Chitinophagaceae bacterium]|nr:hypothetical protein [Chitinophagaceae bacterium]